MTLDEIVNEYKEELKEIIIKFKKELNNNNFKVIYDGIYGLEMTPAFTALLLKNNINPLEYMGEVPKYFAYGLDIEEIVIPDNITSIGSYAFDGCSKLSSITIGNSVTSIGSAAFLHCNKLKDIYYEGSEEDWKNIKTNYHNDLLFNVNIHYNS